jgi:hypothetical protein
MFATFTVKQLRSLIRTFKEHHNIKYSKLKKAQLVAELEKRFVIKDNKLYLKDEIPQQNVNAKSVNAKSVNAKSVNAKSVNAKSVNAKSVNAKTAPVPAFIPQPPPNFTGQMTEQRKQDALAKRVIAQAKNALTINKFRKLIDYEKDKQH